MPLPTYEEMKISDSNIKRALVTDWGNDHLVKRRERYTFEQGRLLCERRIPGDVQFPLLKGNPEIALDDPLSIVITESTAHALFGEEDPMGKSIRVDNEHDLKVTGILKDVPTNSSFQFDVLMTWKFHYQISNMVRHNTTDWSETAYQIFVELNDPANHATVENNIRDMIAKHGEVDVKREFFLYPLLRWRLYSSFNNGRESGGMIDYVTMFSILAFFIIVMACINFMNLATARSERRAREVGIRKSVGSRRFELVLQFISESTLVTLFSFVIAVLLAQLLLPAYNSLVQKQLFIDYFSTTFWLYAIALIVLMGVVSGSYPAFYLSSFQPMKVLKGKPSIGKGASLPRKILVTLQFGFSILMIIGTIVIYQQIQLVKGRDLGYDKENLISVGYNNDIKKNFGPLKLDLLSSGVVEAVVRSNLSITKANSRNYLGWPGKPEALLVDFVTISTDYDWTKTMGIKVIEGRDFSQEFKSDTAAILVNKAAIKLMGLKDPIGTPLDLWGGKWTLIGVVDDVLMGSVYHEVEPMLAVYSTGWINRVTIRLKKTDDLQASLKTVESIFNKHAAAYPFEYTFVDTEFEKKFITINLTSQLSSLFASLAIIITGLGLFGLASFTAEQRTKEIGIRKVLGASVTSLMNLLARDFSVLVIVSFVLASPLAWWSSDHISGKISDTYGDRLVDISLNWPYRAGICIADRFDTSMAGCTR